MMHASAAPAVPAHSTPTLRWVLVGDAQSPHLLKWAQTLAQVPGVHVWVASSRGFLPGFDGCVPAERRLSMDATAHHGGGNVGVLRHVFKLGRWLAQVQGDVLNPHYLTSHGTLVALAQRLYGLSGVVVGSAWGSDILHTPKQAAAYAWLTRWVLRQCDTCTSDSAHMSSEMRAMGAREVHTFPFGLTSMPAPSLQKDTNCYFANRGLEPIYRPDRVIDLFAAVARVRPEAHLVVANTGSLLAALQAQVSKLGLAERVRFVGRLDAQAQADMYDRAQWYLSLPLSDAVSVSVLEAMAHGCIPLLSDLPANRELVRDGDNGWIVPHPFPPTLDTPLNALQRRAAEVAEMNRAWVQAHGLFLPAIERLVAAVRAGPLAARTPEHPHA